MAEGLATPDGAALPAASVDVESGEQDFNAMLARAGENVGAHSPESEPAAPPKRVVIDKSDPGSVPNAPRRGRPPKAERARTREVKPGADKEPAKLEPRDYRPALDALGEVIWLGASQLPFTKPFAPLLNAESRAPMVAAWNEAANQNASVRNAVEKMTGGGGSTWVLGVAMATIPLGMGVFQILTASPETKEALRQKANADLKAWATAKGLVHDEQVDQQAA